VTQPQPQGEVPISAKQHYFDLTVVYCLLLIVLTQIPWPADPARRFGIDVIGGVLLALAGFSFVRARRAKAREKRSAP